jgi:hypothetical protein
MTLVLDNMSGDGRHFHHLVTMYVSTGLHFLQTPPQAVAAMAALLGQHGADFVNSLWRRLRPVLAGMARLAARLFATWLSPLLTPP